MSKLKIPHKKKAMDENTISKPKRSLRPKHKREKVKKSHPHKQEKAKKSRPKKGPKVHIPKARAKKHILRNLWQKLPFAKKGAPFKRQSRFNQNGKREYCQAFSSSDIFAQNAASLSGTYDVDLHPYHCIQPSVIDQVG